jgi:FMN-dependent NADH-azoreductase
VPQLLHLDFSARRDGSLSRHLSARFADGWAAAHPGGTVVYRDFGTAPLPHLDEAAVTARLTPPDEHSAEQTAALAMAESLVGDVRDASEVVIGTSMYNFGPPTTLKAWVDHLLAPGLSVDPVTQNGLLGGRDLTVISARGGAYGAGTPREGWDHVEPWLRHVLSQVDLVPQFILVEMTLADVNPNLAQFKEFAAASRAAAEAAIDERWATAGSTA